MLLQKYMLQAESIEDTSPSLQTLINTVNPFQVDEDTENSFSDHQDLHVTNLSHVGDIPLPSETQQTNSTQKQGNESIDLFETKLVRENTVKLVTMLTLGSKLHVYLYNIPGNATLLCR